MREVVRTQGRVQVFLYSVALALFDECVHKWHIMHMHIFIYVSLKNTLQARLDY